MVQSNSLIIVLVKFFISDFPIFRFSDFFLFVFFFLFFFCFVFDGGGISADGAECTVCANVYWGIHRRLAFMICIL